MPIAFNNCKKTISKHVVVFVVAFVVVFFAQNGYINIQGRVRAARAVCPVEYSGNSGCMVALRTT